MQRMLGLVLAVVVLVTTADYIAAAPSSAVAPPVKVSDMHTHWTRISSCLWYGEDIETNSLSLLGGGGASASAYFHGCIHGGGGPVYWTNGQNRGWVFGYAELLEVYPLNTATVVETLAFGDVMDAAIKLSPVKGVG